MRKLQLFTHCILLATTPTLFAYPQNHLPHVTASVVNYGYSQETEEWVRPTTYDEIMQMLEDLESGELERRHSPLQLEKVNEYLAILAKEGILPDEFEEEVALQEDTYDLMYGEDSAFELARYLENSSEYMIIPAVLNSYSGYNIVQCGKISNAWKKTKKFVKTHKKEIIIGAVIVVAVAIVVVAVVAVSSTTAATAVAGAAGAAASGAVSGSSDSSHSESKEEPPSISAVPKETSPPLTDANEAPVMKAAIGEHISAFKEFLVEDKAAQQIDRSKGWDEMSFGEKAREAGSNIAHQAFDEIADLAKVVPQLCEEAKELGSKFLPESLKLPDSEDIESPIENYENLVANGHKAIDAVFSTDQAELFTAEARANDPMNNFAIGFLPPPGAVFKTFSDTSKFVRAGKALDKAGYTKAGRNLMKHGYREGSAFPKPLGNPAQVNAHGQKVLESIINHPERVIYERPHPDFGKAIEIVVPDKWGARFTIEGEMIGFLEP